LVDKKPVHPEERLTYRDLADGRAPVVMLSFMPPFSTSKFSIQMNGILRIVLGSGRLSALPVRVTWPIHRALIWLQVEASLSGAVPHLEFTTRPDPDVYLAVDGVEQALAALIAEGFLVQSGSGYTARWVIAPEAATSARRELLREDPLMATLLVQAGQRLATWASTALKNVDTAAESWASTVDGSTPAARHPRLVSLR
jgi:hypothetical protein